MLHWSLPSSTGTSQHKHPQSGCLSGFVITPSRTQEAVTVKCFKMEWSKCENKSTETCTLLAVVNRGF